MALYLQMKKQILKAMSLYLAKRKNAVLAGAVIYVLEAVIMKMQLPQTTVRSQSGSVK